MRPRNFFFFAFLLLHHAGCGGCGSRAGAKRQVETAPVAAEPPGLADPAPPPVDMGPPPTPEQLAERAVHSYFRAMERGDLRAMRDLMGGEMAAQFDRVLGERGEDSLRVQVRRGVPLRTAGPGRPAGDGAWVVSCRPPPAQSKSPMAAPQRIDFDVRRERDTYRLYRLTTAQAPAARRTQ